MARESVDRLGFSHMHALRIEITNSSMTGRYALNEGYVMVVRMKKYTVLESDWRLIIATFVGSIGFFLSSGVNRVCANSVGAAQ